ncbi:hypothetical protein [Mesorhizobium sp. M0243]|uniref:hypothetical protein n=1 Tax=Mesorhizobium sp. M0243 TaxID=2956925 RepID=UPI00333A9CE5
MVANLDSTATSEPFSNTLGRFDHKEDIMGMMRIHAAMAVRAYLKAAGLPDFDQQTWSQTRRALLGKAADDENNFLSLGVESTTAAQQLEKHLAGKPDDLS